MQLETTPKRSLKLSLTPLIDVVFLLLIFFMLASTFSRFTSLPLTARSGEGQAAKTMSFILVRIEKEGTVTVNGQRVEVATLVETIDQLAIKPEMKLIIKPIEGSSVQHLVSVLEKARQSKLKAPVVMR